MTDWREDFQPVIDALGETGQYDIDWSENVAALPETAEGFAADAIFVICNSGMKHTVARKIYEDVIQALCVGGKASDAFGHKGKCAAMDAIWRDRDKLYAEFMALPEGERVEWLGGLPWVGPITKYHLAKNFGVDCVKPDVHLSRLAAALETTPDDLCAEIGKRTGLKKRTIDLLIWRACATGVIDSRTGKFHHG